MHPGRHSPTRWGLPGELSPAAFQLLCRVSGCLASEEFGGRPADLQDASQQAGALFRTVAHASFVPRPDGTETNFALRGVLQELREVLEAKARPRYAMVLATMVLAAMAPPENESTNLEEKALAVRLTALRVFRFRPIHFFLTLDQVLSSFCYFFCMCLPVLVWFVSCPSCP